MMDEIINLTLENFYNENTILFYLILFFSGYSVMVLLTRWINGKISVNDLILSTLFFWVGLMALYMMGVCIVLSPAIFIGYLYFKHKDSDFFNNKIF